MSDEMNTEAEETEPAAAEEPAVEDAAAEGMPESEPEIAPEPTAPEMPAAAAIESEVAPEPEPELEPARNHTGLIVVIASIVLILAAFVVVGLVVYPAVLNRTGTSSSSTTTTASKAKITVTIGFVKALLNGDTLAIKPFLADSVQNAITDAQWKELAAQDASAVVSFATPTWTGDSKAQVAISAQDTTGTLTFSIDPAKPLAVIMLADIAGTNETDTVTLVPAGADWRVAAISNGTDTTTFDEALIKSMIATDTAQ